VKKRNIQFTDEELGALAQLGQRLRLGRLRRNLSQEEVAERAGVTRKTLTALEAGRATVGLGVLVKVLAILGYPRKIAELLEADPIGEGLDEVHGRKRARGSSDVADF
jgi:transcriptional regulator with XRE-family HTH domain